MKFSSYVIAASMLVSPALLAKQQFLTLESNIQNIYPEEVFEVNVDYSVQPLVPVSGIGVRVFFDSSQVTVQNLGQIFQEGLIAKDVQADKSNLDNDEFTDSFVNISWASLNGTWPSFIDSSISLANIKFMASENFTGTVLNINSSSHASGFQFIAEPLSILAN